MITQTNTRRRPAGRPGAAALALLLLLLLLLLAVAGTGRAATLEDIDYTALPGDAVQITFNLDEPVAAPRTFNTNDPARIALDFVGVRNGLAERSVDIGEGVVESVSTAEAGGRTRAVLRLSQLTPFDVQVQGSQVFVTVAAAGGAAPEPGSARAASGSERARGEATVSAQGEGGATDARRIEGINFRRGPDGSARIIVQLSDETTPVDVNREGGRIVVDFLGASVPDRLERRLDVTDFATPARFVETRARNGDTRIAIEAEGEYDQIAYQAEDTFTVELQPISEVEQERRAREEPEYTGERLSLNFQDIEVRSVLQLIADFTGLNIVVSDSVSGNITLRLQNVPWDQALDIILRTKGLDKRTNGNVMLVAPAEEIAARERQELESREQLRALEPLRSEFIQVNYAKASDLAELIRGFGGDGEEGEDDQGLLSGRGSISIDQRTNTLIVRDTDQNLSDIRRLVNRLDVPVRQVLIESRLVIASDDFSDELGVRFGYSRDTEVGDQDLVFGGTQPGTFNFGETTGFEVPADEGTEGLLVDLPASTAAGSAGLAIGKVGSYLLQLELSAMESENRGEIISSPRVVTSNQSEAEIRQGVEIPFEEATSSGATSIEFRDAVLGLRVTPQITPDDRVLLDLQVNQDSRGEATPAGPAINTQSVRTQVLVDNGETVVLGGVFERTQNQGVERIPFFGELPLIGWLFRNRTSLDENSELLVFVTPQILDEQLSLGN